MYSIRFVMTEPLPTGQSAKLNPQAEHCPSPWSIRLNQSSINGARIVDANNFRVVTMPRAADRPYYL